MENRTIPDTTPEQSGATGGSGAAEPESLDFCRETLEKQSRAAEDALGPEWAGKLGLGIPGIIAPQEIADAIGSHGLAFFRSDDLWSLSSQAPAAVPAADCVVDLEHDMNPTEYDGQYTVSDMIRDKLDDAETRMSNEAWEAQNQDTEDGV